MTAAATIVDLSRLPPPDVVEQLSFEAVYADALAWLQSPEVLPEFDATVESDPAVKLLQYFSYRELLIRADFNHREQRVMLAYATGSSLDHIAARFNVERLTLDPGDPAAGQTPILESDAALRERVQLSPTAFAVAGPELAYVFHARSADATIRDASATTLSPGVVLICLLSHIGDGTASDAQIAAVDAVVGTGGASHIRPLTDDVIVQSAEILDYMIDARLTLLAGPDQNVVLVAAQAALAALLERSGRLGQDVTRAAIIAALFVEGVQNVELIGPVADLVVNRRQAAHCSGISVAVAGRGD